MATTRGVMRFGGRSASCFALALSLAALVGFHSPAATKPILVPNPCYDSYTTCKVSCPVDDDDRLLACTKRCGAKLRKCMAAKDPPKPTKSAVGNTSKPGPGNTRFPEGKRVPTASTNVGGNSKTLGGSSGTNVGDTVRKPALNPDLGRNATSIGGSTKP
jgi:hypothetical protein